MLRAPVAWVVIGFLATRVLAWAAGVRFDASMVPWGWHFLDTGELTRDYLGSLWRLHAQPPLLNAAVGAVLLLAPGAFDLVFHAGFLALGLAFAVGGHALLVRLGVGPWLAAAAVLAFVASPASILYEHWLFYTHPEAVLVALSALALHRFADAGRRRDAAAFFAALAALALLRSLYHLGLLVLIAAALLACYRHDPGRRRAIAQACVLPIALVFALYAKNAVAFGAFGASTWMGMSFERMSVVQAGPERLRELVAAGRLSPLATYGGFRPLEDYPPAWREAPATGHAVLDAPRKANGSPNFNHLAYVRIGEQLLADGKAVLAEDPKLWLKAEVQAYAGYFRPASMYHFLAPNAQWIRGWREAYETVANGRVLRPEWLGGGSSPYGRKIRKVLVDTGLWLLVGLPALVAYGALAAWRAWRRGPADRPRAVTLTYMVAMVLFTTGVGNALEIGENHRFRFAVDFFFVAFLALWLATRFKAAAPPPAPGCATAAPGATPAT